MDRGSSSGSTVIELGMSMTCGRLLCGGCFGGGREDGEKKGGRSVAIFKTKSEPPLSKALSEQPRNSPSNPPHNPPNNPPFRPFPPTPPPPHPPHHHPHLVVLDDLGDEVAGVHQVRHDGHAHPQDEDVGELLEHVLHHGLLRVVGGFGGDGVGGGFGWRGGGGLAGGIAEFQG